MLMPLTHRQVDIIRLGLTGILEANQKSKSKYKGFFEKLGFSQQEVEDLHQMCSLQEQNREDNRIIIGNISRTNINTQIQT